MNSPGLRIGARHAGQRLHDGDVAQHRVRGHPLSQLDAFGEPLAICHHVWRGAERRACLRVVRATGPHHVHHAGCADQAWEAHRAAATDEDAARAVAARAVLLVAPVMTSILLSCLESRPRPRSGAMMGVQEI
jgi:hypothetical protein